VTGQSRPEQEAVTLDVEVGAAVLAPAGVGHLTPELEGDQLGAVADPEGGDAQRVDLGIEAGGVLDVDRLGAAGQDQGGGAAGLELGGGDRVGDDLAVDVGLTDPAGDELCVLSAEVDDQDRVSALGDSVARVAGPGLRLGLAQ
jgi:hypothetical protein